MVQAEVFGQDYDDGRSVNSCLILHPDQVHLRFHSLSVARRSIRARPSTRMQADLQNPLGDVI